jgi:hypothetical protein
MLYAKGQKLVCVHDGYWEFAFAGTIYTIAPEYCPQKDQVYTCEGYNFPGSSFIKLSELMNTHVETVFGETFGVPNSWGWSEQRFKPLVTKSFSILTDVAMGAGINGPEIERIKFRQRDKKWLKELR